MNSQFDAYNETPKSMGLRNSLRILLDSNISDSDLKLIVAQLVGGPDPLVTYENGRGDQR